MGVLKPDREGEGARGSWIQVPLIRGFPNAAGQGAMEDGRMRRKPEERKRMMRKASELFIMVIMAAV